MTNRSFGTARTGRHRVPSQHVRTRPSLPSAVPQKQPRFSYEFAPAPLPAHGNHLQGSYRIPPARAAAWTSAPSPRRTNVSRAILLCILFVQAVLSLRLQNTAFEDEALYIYAGHLELNHLLHGAAKPSDFTSYFSGSPLLYPVLAAAIDSVTGLAGVRAMGLVFMLSATGLLYSLSRLLFNERAALCAAATFSVAGPTLFLGNFATYDAPAVFLLALAAWIVVRTGRNRAGTVTCLLAAPLLTLAVAVKYAALMYLPVVMALAVLAALPYQRARVLIIATLLPAATAASIAVGLTLAGREHLAGVNQTTTARAIGTDDPLDVLRTSLQWGGPMLALALLGMVLYARQYRMGESPQLGDVRVPHPLWRIMLGVLMCGTALLAPAYQMHLHTQIALHKHIGYGLLFAAPMAGVGMSRLMGAHFRTPQLGIVAWVTVLALGMMQSEDLHYSWPNSTSLVATLQSQLTPGGRYLAESAWVPQYYLRRSTAPSQWISTYWIGYRDRKGMQLTGERGYRAAIDAGYFDVIAISWKVTPGLDDKLARHLATHPKYRLLAKIPYTDSRTKLGHYHVWVRA